MIYYIWQLFTCVAFCIVRIKHFFVFFLIWFKILVYSWNKKIKTMRKCSIKGREFQAQFKKTLLWSSYQQFMPTKSSKNIWLLRQIFLCEMIVWCFEDESHNDSSFIFQWHSDEWIVYEPLVNNGLWYSS